MKALIDFDILRYEIGFGSETGWKNEGEFPPWDFVEELLLDRINYIVYDAGATSYTGYITEGHTFRFDIAKSKPYKGTRKEKKPWHFKNLTAYMVHQLGVKVVTGIEADDQMVIDHLGEEETILCSRDKDLRQCPGPFYSWELGKQPAYGPLVITKKGEIHLSEDKKKIIGNGLAFFYSQLLTGDVADNIPGLPGCGPVKAMEILDDDPDDLWDSVYTAYGDHFNGNKISYEFETYLHEQGMLLWMTRRLNEDGSPVLWSLGMEE